MELTHPCQCMGCVVCLSTKPSDTSLGVVINVLPTCRVQIASTCYMCLGRLYSGDVNI